MSEPGDPEDPKDDPPKVDLPIPLRKEIEGIVEEMEVPAARRGIAVERVEELVLRAEYRGPLPPPNYLKAYEEVLPGLAERIVRMNEGDHEHEHECDKNIIKIWHARTVYRRDIDGAVLSGGTLLRHQSTPMADCRPLSWAAGDCWHCRIRHGSIHAVLWKEGIRESDADYRERRRCEYPFH